MRKTARVCFYLLLMLLASILFVHFVLQRTKVTGPSMKSTLQDGDSLLVNKLSYCFQEPERFDIIVFDYLYRSDTHYIKRVIGLPGETVQIENGLIYINGTVLEEPYGNAPIVNPRRAMDPIVLGPDEYFVLGDNRNNSSDSRDIDVGNVKRSQIVGKIWIRIWPLDAIGCVE